MSEPLPDIDVAVRGDRRAFLQQMSEIARASRDFDVELHPDARGQAGCDVLNLRYRGPAPHDGPGCQLISWPGTDRIAVEMRARRWVPDPPDRTVYSEAARLQVQPLLSAFNKEHGTRYRLRIARTAPALRLSPRSAALLDRFALLAKRASLHPLDWKRFYELARDGRQELSRADLQALLVDRGFPPGKAGYLADIHSHLRAFSRLR